MDDPSGNSFIENPYAPQSDHNIKVTYFDRTKEMIESMGYSYDNQIEDMGKDKENINDKNNKEKKINTNQVQPSYYNKKKDFTVYKTNSEISNKIIDFTKGIDDNDAEELDKYSMSFPTNCFVCGANGFMRSCLCTIPYFKEIIIYCFKCDNCGYKTTEVKGGGGISEKGAKITLKVETVDDLNRDLFKSESSKIIIPEIGFESSDGSLGSMYTTVEGVIDKLYENLKESPFGVGDSTINNKIQEFLNKLKDLKELKYTFTLIIDDPLDNSFIFPIGEPENDKRLIKEKYERTFEQNEELGINDMKVENYENDNNNDKKEDDKK
jgi:zinc finger protein